MAQVAVVTMLVQKAKATHERLDTQQAKLSHACGAIAEAQVSNRASHEQVMARIGLRIKATQALTADRRADHEATVADFASKCSKLADECERLERDSAPLEAGNKAQAACLDVQDCHLDMLKWVMLRRQGKATGH
ncbi:hypothetical protein H4R34_003916 [Dimargaris verticillata]|uniref:Uncharacterized protein n=1 Tax=Dimargaris verticillata TaxID=2761393 RepID=A0A9W8E7R2_9FUNG|nr:hypothetical protein H4R34_003916 [Dimargaris verticillata]